MYVKSQHSLFLWDLRLILPWEWQGSRKSPPCVVRLQYPTNILRLISPSIPQKNKRRERTENTYTALLLQENWAAKKERLFLWPIGLHSSVVQASKASSDILRRQHEQKHLLSIPLNNWSQEYSSSLILVFLSSKILKVSFIWNESNANLKTIVN